VHLAYIWIVCHLSAKNYQNRWKFDAVLTKTNLLSFFETRCITGQARLKLTVAVSSVHIVDSRLGVLSSRSW